MTKEELVVIAEMVRRIIGSVSTSRNSGPSYDLEKAVQEDIEQACWQLGIYD